MNFFLEGALLFALSIDITMATCNTRQKQINLTMCNWQGLRANVLQDTVYIDGGYLWLQQGYDDGCANYINDGEYARLIQDLVTTSSTTACHYYSHWQFGMVLSFTSSNLHWLSSHYSAAYMVNSNEGNFDGYVYYLNLSTPFNTSSDFMTILNNKTVAGGAASNIAPNYINGAMFSNDNEFYLYGGMNRATNVNDPPAGNVVLGYEAYQYNSDAQLWAPNWFSENLPSNLTRYISNGADVSAPSENQGFYFSGMRAPDWGSFTFDDMKANSTADTLITVDMSEMGDGEWTNDTLPSFIPGRSKAELVWLPVSKSGVLVAIGGVVEPVELWRTTELTESQISRSKRISPTFMETVSVYDIESKSWYLQNTTGDIPPQLTQFCSILASASDDSSHNIYIYGGYDGLEYNSNPSDDVYILSVPSFKWIKAYNGSITHGRSGHQCLKVYPDQMLILGGQHVASTNCLEGGILASFNINILDFQDKYDPSEWDDYRVPELVISQIGGDPSGGATTISPSSWTNVSLESIFQTKYPKSIETYWPYGNSNSAPSSRHDTKSLPTWATAVIGVICGLFGISIIILGIWLYRRRQRDSHSSSVASEIIPGVKYTEERKLMYAGGPASPGPGPVSNSTGVDTGANESLVQCSINTSLSPRTVESGGDEVYEMHDSSPAELPTQYNISSFTPTASPPLSPLLGCDSPVSPQSPAESDSGQSYQHSHQRSPSSLSNVPSLSIDNVIIGRVSHFHESVDYFGIQRARHGSEISDASISSDDRGRLGGHETIHEAD